MEELISFPCPFFPSGGFLQLCQGHRRLWADKIQRAVGIKLYLVLMLFGVMNAASDANLLENVKADPLPVKMPGLEILEKQQFYRTLKRLGEDQDEWLKHKLHQLQEYPGTARRGDGVVTGMIKTGKNMPDITIVYKSS